MNEDELSDADLWELKVRQGMPKDEATAYVRARQAPAPEPPQRSVGAGGKYTPPSEADAITRGMTEELAAIRQGMFLPGAADEVGAAVRHPIDFVRHLLPGGSEGPAYMAARDADRAAVERYRTEHPVANVVAGLLGGASTGKYLPTSIGEVKGMKSAVKAIPKLAAEGAAYAGLGAAASSNGTPKERAREGVGAAATGAVLAPILAGALPVVSGATARAADLLDLRPSTTPRPPAGVEFRTTGGASPISGIRAADERANEQVVRAIHSDDLTPEGLLSQFEAARGPVALLDLGGSNLLGVARGARSVQGSRAKNLLPEALQSRIGSQEERIIDYALRDTGLGARPDVLGTAESITERMARDADAMYGAIRGEDVSSPEVTAALKEPAFRRAYERAANIRSNEIAAARLNGDTPPPPLPSIDDLVAGKATPTLGTLDQVKRGLDDVIYSSKREGLGKAEIGSLEQVRHAFVKKLDDAVPAYRDARSAYAGKAALLDALEEGRNHFRAQPQEAKAVLSRMGESEREMYRKGALDAFAQRLENTSNRFDLTKRRPLDDVTLDRKRLRLLFDDEAGFNRFLKTIQEEGRMALSNAFVSGGSNTVDKAAELASIGGGDLGDFLGSLGGGPRGAILSAARALGSNAMQGFTQQTADRLAPKLIAGANGDRATLQSILEDLIATQQAMQARAAGRAGIARGATAATGGLLGQ